MSVMLFKHQKEHIEKYWDAPARGLWFEMGTGKTLCVLLSLAAQVRAGKLANLLVVAPNGAHSNWGREIQKYLPESRVVIYSSRRGMDQTRRVKDLLTHTHGVRILAVNVEALSYPKSEAASLSRTFLKTAPTMFALDESWCIGNPGANRSKLIRDLSKSSPSRRALNGTVIADTPFTAWAQLEFLQPGATGMNYFQFTHEHGIYEQAFYGPRSFSKVVGFRRLDRLNRLLEQYGDFVAKKDCLDLPDKLYVEHEVEMSAEQRKIYIMVKNKIAVQLEGGFVEPISAMALLETLHNITVGFVKHEDGTIEWISMDRIDALMELVESIGKKVVIWCRSRPALAKIAAMFIEKYGVGSFVEYHGGIDEPTRNKSVDKFQNDASCRYFLANQQAGGVSLTLTAASHEIYFRNDYSLRVRLQSEDRCHRIGQKDTVTIIDMVAPNSADAHVIAALKNKQDVAGQVVPFLKKTVRET